MSAIPLTLAAMLFILRAPTAWKRPRARPAWFTTGYALVGFLTLGLVVPTPALDAYLGGRNLVALAQTLFASAALWCLRDAMAIHSRVSARGARWSIASLLAAQTVAFAAIPDHVSVSDPVNYIHQNLPTTAGWIFIVIYQGMVLGLSVDSLRILRGPSRLDVVLFRVGHSLIAFGAVSELAGVTAWHFAGHATPLSAAAFAGFQMLFYPGTMLIAGAYLLVWGRRLAQEEPWRMRRRYLRHLLIQHAIVPQERHNDAGDYLLAAYEQFIDVNNHLSTGDLVLTHKQQDRLDRIGQSLDAQFSATTSLAAAL